MLTCQQLTEVVTEYLEGRMPFTRRMSFWMHVSMCGNCRRYLRQMKLTVKTLGAMPKEPIPPATRAALLERFRTWKP